MTTTGHEGVHLPGTIDVAVIGGGQAALAAGFFLRRVSLSSVLLDDRPGPGGVRRHGRPSPRLFAPARWYSLPGWLMPAGSDAYPSRDETLDHLAAYEERHALPVVRPVRVLSTHADGDRLRLVTDHGDVGAGTVISATGTWGAPVIRSFEGAEDFRGRVLHPAAPPSWSRCARAPRVVSTAAESRSADLAGRAPSFKNRPRGMRRQAEPVALEAAPVIFPAPRLAPTEASRRWAGLLQRFFEVDPLACPTCHGAMRIVAFITQAAVIDQILTHLRTRAAHPGGGGRAVTRALVLARQGTGAHVQPPPTKFQPRIPDTIRSTGARS